MGEGPNRPLVELMVLMITGTVCVILLLLAGGVAIVEVVNPTADTSKAVAALSTVTSTLLGAVLGLIAGHTLGRRRIPDSDD
jgi:hypothetical protein